MDNACKCRKVTEDLKINSYKYRNFPDLIVNRITENCDCAPAAEISNIRNLQYSVDGLWLTSSQLI